MSISATSVDYLVGQVYEASLGTISWQSLLDDIASALSSPVAVIVARPRSTGHEVGLVGLTAGAWEKYTELYGPFDPAIERLWRIPPLAPQLINHLNRDPEIKDSRCFEGHYRPHNIDHLLTVWTSHLERPFVGLGLSRLKSQTPFDAVDVDVVRTIAGHLERGNRIHSRLEAPFDPTHVDVHALRERYGLTAKEAAVASEILRQGSVDTVAKELAMARETVRTHLRMIRQKTSTRSQAQLVRLLLTR